MQIDVHVLSVMEDEDLKKFFPSYGDRIAISDYCKRTQKSFKQKEGLLEKLKKKLDSYRNKEEKKNVSDVEESGQLERLRKKYKVTNEYRQIFIGWFCSRDGNKPIQMRTKQGGGTRAVKILRTSSASDILEEAVKLFFPNGRSSCGRKEKFNFHLLDFQQKKLPLDITINEMFELTRLTRLRVYLLSKRKVDTITTPQISLSEVKEVIYVADASENEENVTSLQSSDVIAKSTCSDQVTPESQYFDHVIDDELESEKDLVTLCIHRGSCLKELVAAFMYLPYNGGKIKIEMIENNGRPEMGIDTGGVLKDALSEFWDSFYDECTAGANIKVPVLSEDFCDEKWRSVAKILYVGIKQAKYFPIKLARPFMEMCCYKTYYTDLIVSLLLYVPSPDSDVLNTALYKWEDVNENELIEVLDSLECKRIPSKENIWTILFDIAHKEIIQKSKHIVDTWNEILDQICDKEGLTKFYESCLPTAKRIIKILHYNENMTQKETAIVEYLKRYLKEHNNERRVLETFLRFCTGANIIAVEKITVTFNSTGGLTRSPVAHTCGCVLELPTTYINYQDFRSEFNSLLTSNVLIMDIA